MNALPSPLEFEGCPIRIIEHNGTPWWVLAEVCKVLEIANPSDVAKRLDEDERDGVDIADPIGRIQSTTIISEPGLYKVIMTSRKPVAKRFDRWVRHEVLPSIRKTGSYGTPDLGAAIIAGMEAMGRAMGVRFDAIESRMVTRGELTQFKCEVVDLVEKRLPNKRQEILEPVKAEHVDAVTSMGGGCPCCRRTIVVQNGQRLRPADFDHFYHPHLRDADHTWLICEKCHDDVTYKRIPRDQLDTRFKAYQDQRRQLPGRQPLLIGR